MNYTPNEKETKKTQRERERERERERISKVIKGYLTTIINKILENVKPFFLLVKVFLPL